MVDRKRTSCFRMFVGQIFLSVDCPSAPYDVFRNKSFAVSRYEGVRAILDQRCQVLIVSFMSSFKHRCLLVFM